MPDVGHLPDANPEITSNQEQPPEYARRFKDFAYAVGDLAREYGKDAFGKMVERFVAERGPVRRVAPSDAATALPPVGTPVRRNPVRDISPDPFETDDSPQGIPTCEMAPCGPDLPLLRMFELNESPTAKTPPEEYAILSAIHDVLCPEDEPIDPFQTTVDRQPETRMGDALLRKFEMVGAAYWALMADVEAAYQGMVFMAKNHPHDPEWHTWGEDFFRELERIRKKVEADLKTRPAGRSRHEPTHSDDSTCSTSAQDGCTIPALREMTGLANTTLLNYAKRAGVQTPGRGKRSYRYPLKDARAILQTIIDTTSENEVRSRCKDSLEKLPQITE